MLWQVSQPETGDLVSVPGRIIGGAIFPREERRTAAFGKSEIHIGEVFLECRFYRGSHGSSIRLFFFRGRSIKISLDRRVDHSIYLKPL